MFLVSQCRGYTNAPIAKSIRLEEADAKIIDAMILWNKISFLLFLKEYSHFSFLYYVTKK